MSEPLLILGNCLEEMAKLEESSVDAIVTDPPYSLSFMSKAWDKKLPGVDVWEQTLRVLKPAHYLLAFGGTRTHHRLMVALEDAGFEIRDTLMWLYGCLSEDTEVLVDGRWEPYHKATAGRYALCYNVEDETYSWQPIQELVIYNYDGTAYRIESDGTDQLVSRNHRCLIHDGNGYTFCYAEEAARQHQVHVPVLEDVQGLLQAIPYVQPDTGITEQDLLARVPERDTSQEETARGARRFGVGGLRRLRQRGMEAAGMGETNRRPHLLTRLQRHLEGRGVETSTPTRDERLGRRRARPASGPR